MAGNSPQSGGGPGPLRRLALFMIGAGLVILGLVAGMALWRPAPAQILRQTEGALPAKASFPAPDLVLQDLAGKENSLKRYLGSYVLVNNWATWCPPCRAEMPALQTFYEEHRAQGFSLVAINAGDPAQQVREFVAQYNLTFLVWLDPEGRATLAFRNQALPSSYLIDPAGRVVLAWSGGIQRETLERWISPLLEQQVSD